jgi:hypothetical protein
MNGDARSGPGVPAESGAGAHAAGLRTPETGAPGDGSIGDLEQIARGATASTARRAPRECGHFDIHIAGDGSWFYRGTPIKRSALVRLFSTVLRRDAAGTYWLSTPAERGRITVADVPFLAIDLDVRDAASGRDQTLIFRTNVDDTVAIGADHPLRVETDEATGAPRPYILVRDGLEARVIRPVFYRLVELGREERVGGTAQFGVWSKGKFFPLGNLDG